MARKGKSHGKEKEKSGWENIRNWVFFFLIFGIQVNLRGLIGFFVPKFRSYPRIFSSRKRSDLLGARAD